MRLGGKAGAVNRSGLASDGLILQTKVEEGIHVERVTVSSSLLLRFVYFPFRKDNEEENVMLFVCNLASNRLQMSLPT